MTAALAAAEPLILMSILKPLLMAVVVIGWAWVVSQLDKDALYYYLPRLLWNGIQIGVGVVAVVLWLCVPYFWLGLLIAVMLLAGGIMGYVIFRNDRVPAKGRWTLSWQSVSGRWDQVQQNQAQRRATVTLLGPKGERLDVPMGEDPKAKAHATFEDVVNFAIPRGADRVDIMADAKRGAISVQIDGVRYPQADIDPASIVALIDYLKEHAGLDVNERRRRLAGHLRIDTADAGEHALALTTFGSTRGLSMTVEFDPESRTWHGYDQIGLLPAQKEQLENVLDEQAHRVAIVACPPQQGLTTTLYSIVQRHDPYTQSVMTLEQNIAFEVIGFNHHMIKPGIEAVELVKRVEAMLRQDPQVMMITELTEPGLAKVVAKSADEQRFYVGMHQQDTFAAMKAWVKMVGDPQPAAEALAAVVSLRLVRRLCTTCRVPYKPNPEVARKLNLPKEKAGEFYKHSGQVVVRNETKPCPDCLGLGYRGRIGVYEVMPMDGQARELLATGQLDPLRAHLRQHQALWLQEAALAKVVEGETSISEITRVFGKETQPAPRTPPPPAEADHPDTETTASEDQQTAKQSES